MAWARLAYRTSGGLLEDVWGFEALENLGAWLRASGCRVARDQNCMFIVNLWVLLLSGFGSADVRCQGSRA